MIAYVDSTGKIIGGCYANSPDVLCTITHTPDGTTAVYIDDTQYPNVWSNMAEYTIQNGEPVHTPIPDSVKLANAQQAKIAELRNGYAQTLAAGFNVTIGGTQYTFGWTTDDKINLQAVQTGVAEGYVTFPLQYSDIHGNPVTISSQTDLTTIEQTAAKFFNAQHQQLLNLLAQVQAANSVSAVEAITWAPASY